MTLEGRTALSVEICTNRWVPTSAAASTDVERAEDVGVGRLERMLLEHRHVLVGGGVEDHLGPVALERLEHGARGR